MKYPILECNIHFTNKRKQKLVAKEMTIVYDENDKIVDYDRQIREAYKKIFSSKDTASNNFNKKSLTLVKIELTGRQFGETNNR